MAHENTTRRITSDGIELAVDEFGRGTPLIFAHGLTSNRAQSRRQMAPLADRHRVIIFDQRGHAESSPIADAALYDVRRMAGDMAAILDTLGVEQAIVGGESLGAGTALRFAVEWPQRVKALVLALPALSDEPLAARQTVKDFGPALRSLGMATFADRNEQEMLKSGATPRRAAEWKAVLRSHQAGSIALACDVVSDWIVCTSDNLRHLDMPVLIIAVEGDPVHPSALAERLRATIPHARLVLLQSIAAYSEDPAIVGHICRDFLNAVM